MNYLVLTPDAVGSTLLQRSLTVYLNASGRGYYNTHELLNGLELSESNALVKNSNIGYTQSLNEIKNLLEKNSANLVSRIADYHVYNRQENKKEDYTDFYSFCNQYFDKILYCTRDPYEYALSWAIRNKTNILNVYSIDERIECHGVDNQYAINLKLFQQKLMNYQTYQYWVADNFSGAIQINYNDLNFDIDTALGKITSIDDFNIADMFGVSLADYSKILYKLSLKKQKVIDSLDADKSLIVSTIKLYQYQNQLIKYKKLVSRIPLKMNTLANKKSRILNFDETIDVYNQWAKNTNLYSLIDNATIQELISKEAKRYDT